MIRVSKPSDCAVQLTKEPGDCRPETDTLIDRDAIRSIERARDRISNLVLHLADRGDMGVNYGRVRGSPVHSQVSFPAVALAAERGNKHEKHQQYNLYMCEVTHSVTQCVLWFIVNLRSPEFKF